VEVKVIARTTFERGVPSIWQQYHKDIEGSALRLQDLLFPERFASKL
jgi:hypothetical protein